MSDAKLKCFSGCCIFCVILAAILFGLSFSSIEVNSVALQKDKFSVKVDESTIYLAGRYYVGLSGTFITYPTSWQTIEFSSESGANSPPITGKTSDPATIQISISLMYRLKIEFLHSLFKAYPAQNHQTDMMNSAKDSIQKVINLYSNNDFFIRRDNISAVMSRRVNSVFRSKFNSEITFFQLNSIILAAQFEDSLIKQQVNKREALTSTQKQFISVIQGEINVINSEADILINQIIADAKRNATLIRAQAQAKGDSEILNAQSNGYKTFLDTTKLNFTQQELIQFIYLDKLRETNSSLIYSGFTSPNFKISK